MPSNYAPPICPKHAIRSNSQNLRLKTLIDTIDGFEKNRAINEQLLGVKGSRPVGSPQLLGRPFVAAGKTYHGHQDQARLPVRRLLLPSCQVHQVRTRPGYQAVVFFFLLARFTRSRTPVFLLLQGPGHQSSCFFLLRRPSPTDSGVNGCPRLYNPNQPMTCVTNPDRLIGRLAGRSCSPSTPAALIGWPSDQSRATLTFHDDLLLMIIY